MLCDFSLDQVLVQSKEQPNSRTFDCSTGLKSNYHAVVLSCYINTLARASSSML
jgi:hypothetical protein